MLKFWVEEGSGEVWVLYRRIKPTGKFLPAVPVNDRRQPLVPLEEEIQETTGYVVMQCEPHPTFYDAKTAELLDAIDIETLKAVHEADDYPDEIHATLVDKFGFEDWDDEDEDEDE